LNFLALRLRDVTNENETVYKAKIATLEKEVINLMEFKGNF